MIRRAISSSKTFIKYIDREKCVDCAHCMRLVSKEPEFFCGKFGVKNLVDGSVSYQEVGKCRNNQYLCSTFGTFFELKVKKT